MYEKIESDIANEVQYKIIQWEWQHSIKYKQMYVVSVASSLLSILAVSYTEASQTFGLMINQVLQLSQTQ